MARSMSRTRIPVYVNRESMRVRNSHGLIVLSGQSPVNALRGRYQEPEATERLLAPSRCPIHERQGTWFGSDEGNRGGGTRLRARPCDVRIRRCPRRESTRLRGSAGAGLRHGRRVDLEQWRAPELRLRRRNQIAPTPGRAVELHRPRGRRAPKGRHGRELRREREFPDVQRTGKHQRRERLRVRVLRRGQRRAGNRCGLLPVLELGDGRDRRGLPRRRENPDSPLTLLPSSRERVPESDDWMVPRRSPLPTVFLVLPGGLPESDVGQPCGNPPELLGREILQHSPSGSSDEEKDRKVRVPQIGPWELRGKIAGDFDPC